MEDSALVPSLIPIVSLQVAEIIDFIWTSVAVFVEWDED